MGHWLNTITRTIVLCLEQEPKECLFAMICLDGAFSNDVRAAILVFQNNETAAMLVFLTNLVGVGLFSYVNNFFCSHKFA